MRRAQRDAEKAVLTKLRRKLVNMVEQASDDAYKAGVRHAIREVDDMLKGDSQSHRNKQGQ